MEWGQARSERHKRGFGDQGLQAGSQGLGFRERLAWVRRSVQREWSVGKGPHRTSSLGPGGWLGGSPRALTRVLIFLARPA